MNNSNNKNVTIIGGTKGLGKWIAKFFKSEKFNVKITSRDHKSGSIIAQELNVAYSDNNIEAIQDANIIIFSVPIETMTTVIQNVAPHAPEGSVILDVASVKTKSSEALYKYTPKNVEVLPTHPMFGPRIPSLDGQVVILTPKNQEGKWFLKAKAFLKKYDTKTIISTPEEHDKMMSVVQGLTHFSYIAIASTIRKLGISIKRSRDYASPIYGLMLDMISRIVSQNPYLYYSIQKENQNTHFSRKALISEMNSLNNFITQNEEEKFVETMSKSAKHLDEFEESLGRSDKAIESLNRDLNILKSSLGKEVGLEHQYSHVIHLGIVEKVTNNNVILSNKHNNNIKLKLSNIRILTPDELFDWKKNNLTLFEYDISVVFLNTCNKDCLLDMFHNIKPVITVKIVDTYQGNQIKDDFMSITFHYSIFNKEDKKIVETYIQGIGGQIR